MTRSHSLPFPPALRRVLVAGAFAGVALASAGCAGSTPQPAADPTGQQPTFGANDMPPGTKVMVARQGNWYPASIVQPLGEGRFMIHYDNTGDQWNEVVGPDRIKKPDGGPGGAAHDYRPGDKVLVTYQNRTLLADVVMAAGADQWRVHYDGFGPEATEQVGPDRIRRPFTGPSGHAVGESLQIDVNGQVLPGKVIAVTAADRWLVRFDSYGPQYDQEVSVDRIRAAPPPAAAPPVAAAPEPPPPPKPEKPEKPEKAEKDKDKGKPKPTAEAGPAVPSGPPAVGENVLVSVRGAWFPASVTAATGGAFKVKFAHGGEEEVPADRIVREPGSVKGLRYQPSQLVLVEYKGVYVPGKVLKQEGKGEYKVRFDGTGPENDEVVPTKRLKPR